MDEIQLNYNAYMTIIELCKDRNYIISNEYLDINFETFKYLYLNKQTDIYCQENSVSNKKIYIKFVKVVFVFLFYTTNLIALENKIIVKVNNEIITSVDIENETNYLTILNPQVKNLEKR